ncbi:MULTISPECIES: hypothetical protein [Hungatella]|uniref:Uncharacterized protein n=1 Tax=Hungatella hathewayi TaxID=154046 RepID=A0A3E3DDD9_9FIRM|nr:MULTISPECIES: hypothetical protein [Hungatella]RGD67245.1 hypothetical protein DWX31_28225 [Hungatella hathewayi]
MMKKMCPVCDLPVNAGNYCPRCRRVIRNPYTQNVDYYLNERHPEHETECGFHNPYLEADHHGESGNPASPAYGSSAGRPVQGRSAQGSPVQGGPVQGSTVPNKPVQRPFSGAAASGGGRTPGTGSINGSYRNPAEGSGAYRTATGGYGAGSRPTGTGSMKPEGKKSNAGKTVLIMAAVGLVTIAMVAFTNLEGYLSDYLKGAAETTEAYNYDYESDFTRLNDEDVIEAGEPCMAYYHFPADGVYVSEQLLAAVESTDFGYKLDSDELYTDNYLYDDTSYFESIRSLYLEDNLSETRDDEYTDQYIDVNYDTATNELHEYATRFYSSEASLTFLERFLTATEESSGIAAEDRKADEIMEEARDIVKQEQSSYIYEGLFVIEIYRYEGDEALYVYASYNDPELGSEL